MGYKKWTDENLKIAVETSATKSEVIRKLGLKTNCSGNFQTIDKYINKLGLSTSHFKSEVFGAPSKQLDIKDILVENSQYTSTQNLKKKLLKLGLLHNTCYDKNCGIIEWHGQKLSLQLDHINGYRSDNRIENLRLLCPNCHSLTSTYCRGANRQSKKKCIDCGVKTTKMNNRCQTCDGLFRRNKTQKIIWPDVIKLQNMVDELGYKEVGNQLGISDNAVRKRLKTRMDNSVRSPEVPPVIVP